MGDVAKNLKPVRAAEKVEPLANSGIVRDSVAELLAAIPFPPPDKPPGDAPEWPHNLADVSDEDLGEHMSYWASMVAYASYHVAIQDSDRKVLDWQRTKLYNEALVGVYEDNVTVARAQAEGERSVVLATEEQLRVDTRYRVMQAVLEGLSMKYQAISREITRRMSQRERKV
jgi:hypothetical protein